MIFQKDSDDEDKVVITSIRNVTEDEGDEVRYLVLPVTVESSSDDVVTITSIRDVTEEG